MPRSFIPSIVPNGQDQTVYLVLNDFRRHGHAYCETSDEGADHGFLSCRLSAEVASNICSQSDRIEIELLHENWTTEFSHSRVIRDGVEPGAGLVMSAMP